MQQETQELDSYLVKQDLIVGANIHFNLIVGCNICPKQSLKDQNNIIIYISPSYRTGTGHNYSVGNFIFEDYKYKCTHRKDCYWI